MSRINKMKLKDIFDETDLILRENDIIFFCTDLQVIEEFITSYNGSRGAQRNVKNFLIENEDKIDKEKLILLLVKNYQDNLKTINARKKHLKTLLEAANLDNENEINEFSNLNKQEYVQSENLKKAIKLARGIEVVIPFYTYDEKEQKYKVEIVDSREIIDGKPINISKNLKRYEEIHEYFKNKDSQENFGIEYVLQSLLLTDLYEIFSDAQLGDYVRTMILENAVIRDGIKTRQELEHLKSTKYEEYSDLIDDTEFISLLPEVNKTLKQYVQYIDIDKLLLIAAYRFQEGLEDKFLDGDRALAAREILRGILENVKNRNFKISCSLQMKKDKLYESHDIQYSAKDIEKCINKFSNNEYITDEMIKQLKDEVNNRKIDLYEIAHNYIDIIYSIKELEEIAILSDENLKYVLTKLEWDKDKIVQAINDKESCSTFLLRDLISTQKIGSKDIVDLYLNEKLDIAQIENIQDIIDLSENVNSYELIQYYKNSIEKDSTEEDKDKFNKYLAIYKEVLINNKTEEELEENHNELVNSLLDNYEGEEYINVAEHYYKKGLLTLEVLLEWNEEKIIDRFYKDGIISLTDIEALVKSNNLSFEYISNIYSKLANKEDIDYDERLNYIKTGYVLEKEIFSMYERGLLFEKDLRDLAENGIVRIEQTEKLINNRTKEDLEKNSSIRLIGLNELTKINNDIYSKEDEESYNKTDRQAIDNKPPKLIIDPNIRSEYINLFNAFRAETDLEEDSPFYDYEFYVIPDESGDIGLNSVVIAERYYEDKDTEEQFALNNATYFFRYKDLMVLSNLKKSEMTKERENVVFTAKHILADEKKNGYWAAGVIYGISKTMLSSDLKEYTKTEQRKKILEKLNEIYSNEEVLEILDMASDIDSGKYTYEIQDPKDKVLRKTTKSSNKIKKDILDDNESR